MKSWQKLILAALAGLAFLCVAGLALPPIRDRVFNRVDQLRIRIFYALNPPEQAVFTPVANPTQIAAAQATLTRVAGLVTPTPAPTATATATPLPPDVPTPAPTATKTPPPASAMVENVPYVDQHYGYNNCAPANLTMALKFWGWPGKREDVSVALKPFDKDKNVMPYELTDYVNSQTGLRAQMRVGGTDDVLKRLIAGGYPVLVERGVYLRDISGVVSWMGHYQFVYGYDDAQAKWQVKDSFEQGGDHFTVTYDELTRGWRSFDFTFIVVYPTSDENTVMDLLGPFADDAASNRAAADRATQEYNALQGQDQFFAMFNRGSSLVRLQDYNSAAEAYDLAFKLYAALPADKRPWRMLWYQTGPYYAYFYTGRLQDVVSLADKTIKAASEPYIEESWVWRARAKAQLGDTQGAIEDARMALQYHPNFDPATALLQQLGATQ